MTSFVKSLDPNDYADIGPAVDAVKHTVSVLTKHGAEIAIPHPHRLWEYGSAVAALTGMHDEHRMKKLNVLDIGAGWSALGPTLSYMMHLGITEAEPDYNCRAARVVTNNILKQLGRPTITVLSAGIEHLVNVRDQMFDAVFCISVMEHIPRDWEKEAWKMVASKVKPGGLLFLTVDCVPEAGKHYVMDNLRTVNFTTADVEERVSSIKSLGFQPMGVPDFTYRGSYVHDYTFFRIGVIRDSAVPASASVQHKMMAAYQV